MYSSTTFTEKNIIALFVSSCKNCLLKTEHSLQNVCTWLYNGHNTQ